MQCGLMHANTVSASITSIQTLQDRSAMMQHATCDASVNKNYRVALCQH
jgi:hypothetical protein